ncbi:MAG: hypothetical protein AUH86_15245 [Acidobacteria bacterium 13_1_40CM_4_58_4]|nr:MAG: hypothetical protein AUH86_15245 [Acidobacteria bacterium 13_1_40CM_4_58_4]
MSGLAVYFIRLQIAARRCAGIEDKRHAVWISEPVPKSRTENGRKSGYPARGRVGSFLLLRCAVRVRKTVRIETIEYGFV